MLVEAAHPVVAVDKRVGEGQPLLTLGLSAAEVRRLAQVPAGHHVREGVVVDGLVVFVRSDHPVQVGPAVGPEASGRGPVARRLEDQVAAGACGEGVVASPFQVAGSRPGDVGDDVLLGLACANARDFPGREVGMGRRDVVSICRRLPRKAGAATTKADGLLARLPKATDAVLEHRPRCCGVGGSEEGEDEHVAVPEDVAAVAGT